MLSARLLQRSLTRWRHICFAPAMVVRVPRRPREDRTAACSAWRRQAVKYLEERRAQNMPLPDTVLLDIQMPGMDGFEVRNPGRPPCATATGGVGRRPHREAGQAEVCVCVAEHIFLCVLPRVGQVWLGFGQVSGPDATPPLGQSGPMSTQLGQAFAALGPNLGRVGPNVGDMDQMRTSFAQIRIDFDPTWTDFG